MNRRHFLTTTTALAVGGSVPTLWRRAASAATPGPDEPVLVLIELTGGNDGLNTVIPYQDDAYHRARPTLRIEPDRVLPLDNTLGLHPAMTGLKKLWDEGHLRVLMNVGYPNPNRSHFRSMAIWQSGDLEPSPTTGWLGRLADLDPAQAPPCFVGEDETPLAVRGRHVAPFTLAYLESLRLKPDARLDRPKDRVADDRSPLARVHQVLAATRDLEDQVAQLASGTEGQDQTLAGRLATIRTLLEADAGPRVYYTALDGFDTHARQQFTHQNLLRTLSDALTRFHAELAERRLDDRVVVLVFSEFGRRVVENGAKGTDHGAAAPMLLVGAPVAGGVLGGPPDLENLGEGDVCFTLDFRDVYASILRQWLGIDPAMILGPGRDDRLEWLDA